MTNSDTRQNIVAAADELFYQRGFEGASFADIAAQVGISRGNFYHHFKTKDDILNAVIAARLEHTRAMIKVWELESESPRARIQSYIDILVANRAKIKKYGCPVGELCTELAKLGHPARAEANKLFTLFRVWLRRQFALLGREAEADALAMYVLSRSQGAAVMASAFHDEKFLKSEARDLSAWLDARVTEAANPANAEV